MELNYFLIERDVVIDEIYSDFVHEAVDDVYLMHLQISKYTYELYLSENKQEAYAFYAHFSMLLCSFYDNDGIKEFYRNVRKYINKEYMNRIYANETNSIIHTYEETMYGIMN